MESVVRILIGLNVPIVRKSGPKSMKIKVIIKEKPHILWLHLRYNYNIWGLWSYWPDLNRRPADYESAALPTEPQ